MRFDVLRWRPEGASIESVDSAPIPPGLKSLTFSDECSQPLRLGACSANQCYVLDLERREHPRRIVAELDPGGDGTCKVVSWVDRSLVVARGPAVRILDLSASTCSWQWRPEDAPQIANVESLAPVGGSLVVASWANSSASKSLLRLLDVRSPPAEGQQPQPIARGLAGVAGLCVSSLQPHQCASYSQNSTVELFVWDLRLNGRSDKAQTNTSVVVGLEKNPLRGARGLEWSPIKVDTVVVCADQGPVACRLSPPPDEGVDGNLLRSWLCLDDKKLNVSPLDGRAKVGGAPLACCWASARPGAVLSLFEDDGGAIGLAWDNCRPLCNLGPGGGGIVVRQWPSKPSRELRGHAGEPPNLALLRVGDTSDICTVMRLRAERFDYGVKNIGYDEYSRVVRETGAANEGLNQALAATWQWAKHCDLVDTENSTGSWEGVIGHLTAGGYAGEQMSEILCPSIHNYSSEGRQRALRSLGYTPLSAGELGGMVQSGAVVAEVWNGGTAGPEQARPACTHDEAVRCFLRAILYLQFDSAAQAVELLRPHTKTQSQALLTHLALLMHAAHGLQQFLAVPSTTAPQTVAGQASVLRGAFCQSLRLDWQGLPNAASVRLGLWFVDAMATAIQGCVGSPGSEGTLDDPSPSSRGGEGFEEVVTKACLDPALQTRHPCGSVEVADNDATVSDLGHAAVRFRCAIGLRFLVRERLTNLLDELAKRCIKTGMLDGLCITGLGGAQTDGPLARSQVESFLSGESSPAWTRKDGTTGTTKDIQLIEEYVLRTGDVQTAGLLLCHGAHLKRPPLELRRFIVKYAELLTRWQMVERRVLFHQFFTSQLPQEQDVPVTRGAAIYCYACGWSLTGPGVSSSSASGAGQSGAYNPGILQSCPNPRCPHPVPSCAVCLMPIFVMNAAAEREQADPTYQLPMSDWVAWCQSCHHGGHMGHLEEWFERNTECPVAGCDCQCGLI